MDLVVKDGYKSVLNLRRPEEANLEGEEELVKARGLTYVHAPVVASPDGIDAKSVRAAAEKLHDMPQPVFVHCASGGRASAVVLAHDHLHKKSPETFQAWQNTAASNGFIYNQNWQNSLRTEFFP